MRRGTTPTLKIKVNGIDVDQLKNIYITIKQGQKEITKVNEEVDRGDGNILSVSLTQEDTLKFFSGHADIQLRAITDNGVAVASNVKEVLIERILKEGVII